MVHLGWLQTAQLCVTLEDGQMKWLSVLSHTHSAIYRLDVSVYYRDNLHLDNSSSSISWMISFPLLTSWVGSCQDRRTDAFVNSWHRVSVAVLLVCLFHVLPCSSMSAPPVSLPRQLSNDLCAAGFTYTCVPKVRPAAVIPPAAANITPPVRTLQNKSANVNRTKKLHPLIRLYSNNWCIL